MELHCSKSDYEHSVSSWKVGGENHTSTLSLCCEKTKGLAILYLEVPLPPLACGILYVCLCVSPPRSLFIYTNISYWTTLASF